MSSPLSIAYLAGPLAAEPHAMVSMDLVAALVKRGHRVTVFAGDGPLSPRFSSTGAEVVPIGLTGSFLADLPRLKRLLAAVADAGADVVHAGDLAFERHAAAISRRHGIPCAQEVWRPRRRDPAARLRGRRLFVVPSRSLGDDLTLRGRIPADTIRVVPPGVDPERVPSPSPPFTGERRVLGTVGGFTRDEGLEDLVEAMAHLVSDGRRSHLLIAGAGPEDETLRRRARDLGVARHVTVADLPADFESVVTNLDVVVAPGREDGLAWSIPQAMAASRPVVAAGVGAAISWVEEGVTGLLAPRKSPAELAERIAWILDRPMRAVEMGLAGRNRVLADHRAEDMAAKMEEVYLELLRPGATA